MTSLLDQPLLAFPRTVDRPVWHCSLRTAPGDRRLSDAEWDDVARTVLDRTGLAPRGDDAGCRWVAIRHAEDHIHLVVTLARQDGRRASTSNDFYRLGEACRAVETRYGLAVTGARDRTAPSAPVRGEAEKARRTGRDRSPRATLQREVRHAAAAATTAEDFFARLRGAGVLVRERFSHREEGKVTGYAVALGDDRDSVGEPVWFSGGKLAADLSWPKVSQRWAASSWLPSGSDHQPPQRLSGAARAEVYRAATAVARQAATEIRHLGRHDPGAAGHIAASAADALTAVSRLVEGRAGGPLSEAAEAFDRAGREAWGRMPPPTATGYGLRAAARRLASLGRARAGEQDALVHLLLATARLATAVGQLRAVQERPAQAAAAHRAAGQLHRAGTAPATSEQPPASRPHRARHPEGQGALFLSRSAG